MFIVIDGLDGCGKDTQLKAVQEALENSGHKVKVFGNVDSGPLAKDIRRVLKPESQLYVDNFHLSLLILTNMKMIYKKILEAEAEGCIVLCGRWTMSSIAYGCYDQTLDRREIIERVIGEFEIKPDITFYLSITPSEAARRINTRCCSTEIYDNEDKLKLIKDSFDRVYSSALHSYHSEMIDGYNDQEDITSDILEGLFRLGLHTLPKTQNN